MIREITPRTIKTGEKIRVKDRELEVEIEIIKLGEKENQERQKRLARHILRIMEEAERRKITKKGKSIKRTFDPLNI